MAKGEITVKRKVYIIILVAFIVGFFIITRTPKDASFDESITLRVAGDNNHPPYEYVDENGIFKGFNVDIMNALSIELGIHIEYMPMEWSNALKALEEKKVDLIQGISKTEEREKKFLFTKPTAINSQSIFVMKDTSIVSGIEDLSGLRVALQEGDINHEILKNIPNIVLITKSDQKEAINALISGEVDASVGNRLTGLYYSQRERMSHLVKIVGEPMRITEYGIATYMGNENLVLTLDQGLERLKTNGTYDKIYSKWFGEEITQRKDIIKAYLKEITIITGVIFIIIILFIIWNKKLSKEVYKRTKELQAANKELLLYQKEIHKLAYYDTVTSLPNRAFLTEAINKSISQAFVWNTKFALLILDLDKFKDINDTLGHEAGDMVLKLVGERVNKVVRKSDVFGRFGGDEFLVLMTEINHTNEAISLANRILDAFKTPFILYEEYIHVTTSIGIGIYPEAGETARAIIKNADMSMYRAKNSGGNRYCIYTKEI